MPDEINVGDITDSGNSEETNNSLTVGVVDSFNEDNSVNDSGNLAVAVEDSFNETITTETTVNTWDIDDSGNVETVIEDNSVNGSFNNESDISVDGSFNDDSVNDSNNTLTFTSSDDHSVNAGNREYNTGFSDVTFGAMAGAAGGGETQVWSQSTIVDQSVNGNIVSGGDVFGFTGNSAVVASGEGAMAAGGDISASVTLDSSTNIDAGGDINLGNETTTTNTIGSGNTFLDESTTTDESTVIDVTDSFNDSSVTYDLSESFNDTTTTSEVFDGSFDVDLIVDSDGSAIVGDVDFSI